MAIPIIEAARQGDWSELAKRISQNDDVNQRNEDGLTALHFAAASGARPCIRVLVASGKCDYLLQDNRGNYASDLASEWAKDYAVARLIRKKAREQAQQRGVAAWVPFSPVCN